jgi:hypothetical protein
VAVRRSFIFGIPLLPRACAGDWRRIEELLELTLASVFAQTDQDFKVLIAGHDKPRLDLCDPRIEFLEADWPAGQVRADNLDRGRKTWLINRRVVESGGGLLMLLDADDWVERELVAASRACIAPDHAAGLIETGYAIDFGNLRAAAIPDPVVFPEAFHRICGSSSVLQVRPDSSAPLLSNPYAVLHEHYRLPEVAAEHGAHLGILPVAGGYLINTCENHSENYGPFAGWRAQFTAAVNRHGFPVDANFTARFGIADFGGSARKAQ